MFQLQIPDAPSSIQKGIPLKMLLDIEAVSQLAINLHIIYPKFRKDAFVKTAMLDIKDLTLTQRAKHISESMREHLPDKYEEALSVILKSLTRPLKKTEGNGLAPMFYMPHCNYIADYGADPIFNDGEDPFDASIAAQYELTKRFTCEFSIRNFIIADQQRTLEVLYSWINDSDPHIRRLTTEGTRSRLPWAKKIDSFVKDPSPILNILEALKNDPDLYVRRSVANHIGDIAKDNMDLAFSICERWLKDADKELKWVIRHAVRNPFKKGIERAIQIRLAAK
jgi:3-methyladenine DNA glycosylase AlkC